MKAVILAGGLGSRLRNDFVIRLGYKGYGLKEYFSNDLLHMGGRLKRVARRLEGEAAFCMTYGDGVADIDIGALVNVNHSHSGNVRDCYCEPGQDNTISERDRALPTAAQFARTAQNARNAVTRGPALLAQASR